MFRQSLAAVLFLTASTTVAQADIGERFLNMFDKNNRSVSFAPANKKRSYNRPPASFKGQWYTTQDGCSYSRANPPGGISTWHLILNPHHIGQPPAHRGCAVMM